MNSSAFLQYAVFIKLFDTLDSIQLKRMDMMLVSIGAYKVSNHKISQSICNHSIICGIKVCANQTVACPFQHHVSSLSKLNGEYKVRSSTKVVCTF